MFFPVIMYGWESWTVKKAEHQKIDALELWMGQNSKGSEVTLLFIHLT